MGRYLSAIRFKENFLGFVKGEALHLDSIETYFCGPFGVGKSSLLKALFDALSGGDSPIELNYAPITDVNVTEGVLYIDFSLPIPSVKALGSAVQVQPMLSLAAQTNNKAEMFRILTEEINHCIIILDEPNTLLHPIQHIRAWRIANRSSYFRDKGIGRHNQLIIAQPTTESSWGTAISVGNKCWVSSKHIRCARGIARLTEPINKNTSGYIVRIDSRVFAWNHSGRNNHKYFYLEGKSILNLECTCAHVYKTRSSAEAAIRSLTSGRGYPSTPFRLAYQGPLDWLKGVRGTSKDKFEILPLDEHMDYIFNLKED